MTDDILVDNGSLTDYNVATDDDGSGKHVQIVKLAQSADGSRTPIVADSSGLQVQGGIVNNHMAPASQSASLTGTGQALTIVLQGRGAVGFEISGTFVGTVQFEASVDGGTDYFSVGAIDASDGSIDSSATAIGNWTIGTSGYSHFRVRCSAFTSGSIALASIATYSTRLVRIENEPVSVDDNGGSLTVDDGASSLTVDAVDLDIRNLDVAQDDVRVGGMAASDAAVADNPVTVGGRASSAAPTEVSTDGDAVFAWLTKRGAMMSAPQLHAAVDGAPYTLLSKTVQTTTTQTGSDVLTVTSGKKLVVTCVQIQVGGTVAGAVQVWFGANADTTYSRGTDKAIFDGEFAPSATLKPGVVLSPAVPFIGAVDEEIHLTTSAAINPLTITVWYYEI